MKGVRCKVTRSPDRCLWLLVLLLAFVGAARGFVIPRDSLDNGLVLLLKEERSLPIVTLRFSIRGGSAFDPPGQDGRANLAAVLFTRGTESRPASRLNQEIEFVGGRLNSNADFDHVTVDIQTLSKDLDLGLDLMADMILRPAFQDSELVRAKREARGEIRRQNDDPGDIVYREYYRLLFAGHPYGHPVIGYDSTVAAITREQILDFHRTWVVPGNCYLTAVGDFDRTELKARLEARFGAWPRRPVPETDVGGTPPPGRPRGRVITRPEMNQAYIFLGHVGIREGAPDVFPTRLMNYILGGSGMDSRLGYAIRQNRGLAYDARSFFDRRRFVGGFAASTQTRSDSAPVAIDLIRREMRRMRDEPVTEEELKRTMDYYTGSFPLDFEGLNQKLSIIDRIELYSLGTDYLERFLDNVRKVTRADVQKAAQDHLFPDNYLLVVVSNIVEADIKLPDIEWLKE